MECKVLAMAMQSCDINEEFRDLLNPEGKPLLLYGITHYLNLVKKLSHTDMESFVKDTVTTFLKCWSEISSALSSSATAQ